MISKLFNFEKLAVTCRKITNQQATDERNTNIVILQISQNITTFLYPPKPVISWYPKLAFNVIGNIYPRSNLDLFL